MAVMADKAQRDRMEARRFWPGRVLPRWSNGRPPKGRRDSGRRMPLREMTRQIMSTHRRRYQAQLYGPFSMIIWGKHRWWLMKAMRAD